MVGYCDGGFTLCLPEINKIVKSRDEKFDESIMEYKVRNGKIQLKKS